MTAKGYIFTNGVGAPFNLDNLSSREELKDIFKSVGIEYYMYIIIPN